MTTAEREKYLVTHAGDNYNAALSHLRKRWQTV